jgi:hypothetical protein
MPVTDYGRGVNDAIRYVVENLDVSMVDEASPEQVRCLVEELCAKALVDLLNLQ